MIDSNLLNTLKLGFSSSIQRIKVPSLDKNRQFSFREPNVKEVNTFSKVVLSNSDSQSTIYASSLVLLKYLCLDEDFNPYAMNEIDRLKLLTFILSGIFFSKNLTIKCPKNGCRSSFPFSIKYGDIMEKMDAVSSKEFLFENKSSAGNVRITAAFPKTSRYLDFLEFVDGIRNSPIDYKSFNDSFVEIDNTASQNLDSKQSVSNVDTDLMNKIKRRRDILKGKVSNTTSVGNTILGNIDVKNSPHSSNSGVEHEIDVDMSYLYIKNMTITGIPGSNDDFSLEFENLDYTESAMIMDVLPMRLFIDDENDTNFMKFIGRTVETSMNECSPKIVCPTCGCTVSDGLGVQNFFIHG